MEETKIALFKGKEVRRIFQENQWWFVIFDVVEILSESSDVKQYIKRMKQRDLQLANIWECLVKPLEITTAGGKQNVSCANTEGILRIIQSIPSPKAEPFKRWLAKVGYERIQEIENPELAAKRTREFYKLKGYSEQWIEKRMRSIAIREELTDEWKTRGAKSYPDYEILTSEISKATFGMTPKEYKKLKGLKKENLRDHMDDFELIFTMLGEKATTEIHRNENSKSVPKLKKDAKVGGNIAGGARKQLEKKLGRSLVTKENYLKIPQNKKHLIEV